MLGAGESGELIALGIVMVGMMVGMIGVPMGGKPHRHPHGTAHGMPVLDRNVCAAETVKTKTVSVFWSRI